MRNNYHHAFIGRFHQSVFGSAALLYVALSNCFALNYLGQAYVLKRRVAFGGEIAFFLCFQIIRRRLSNILNPLFIPAKRSSSAQTKGGIINFERRYSGIPEGKPLLIRTHLADVVQDV
ncbi:hypothetical protein CDAR_4881 [Caerostris darwini]|uniref:Uncharacterized protein n=1 Tax=Caerostris darwini TaxID=1538125 RepID=A0AAV4P517_9ARAC|nr:hypothetical protein CDAR_4881 [Caerostris darwini]